MAEKESQRIRASWPVLTFLILVLSTLIFSFPQLASVFIFDREAVMQGQIWRFFSAHFVHFTGTHLVYNLSVFTVAGWIVERKSRFHFGVLCVLMALGISLALLLLKPAMSSYGGLSGLVCGLIFYAALIGVREPSPWRTISGLVIFFMPIKIILEIYNGGSILPYPGQTTFVTMPISHVGGMLVAFLFYRIVGNYKNHPHSEFNLTVVQGAENARPIPMR